MALYDTMTLTGASSQGPWQEEQERQKRQAFDPTAWLGLGQSGVFGVPDPTVYGVPDAMYASSTPGGYGSDASLEDTAGLSLLGALSQAQKGFGLGTDLIKGGTNLYNTLFGGEVLQPGGVPNSTMFGADLDALMGMAGTPSLGAYGTGMGAAEAAMGFGDISAAMDAALAGQMATAAAPAAGGLATIPGLGLAGTMGVFAAPLAAATIGMLLSPNKGNEAVAQEMWGQMQSDPNYLQSATQFWEQYPTAGNYGSPGAVWEDYLIPWMRESGQYGAVGPGDPFYESYWKWRNQGLSRSPYDTMGNTGNLSYELGNR